MPTEARSDKARRNWIVGGIIAAVALYFIWNAVSGSQSGGPITNAAEYEQAISEAEKLSLKHLEAFDRGEELSAQDKQDLTKAATLFDRMSEVQANNIAPFVGAGKIYQVLGQDEIAIQRLVQGLSTVPDKPIPAVLDTAIEAHYLLSVSNFNLKRYDEALAQIDIAIKMFKNPSPIYLTQRARIKIEKREYESAQADLTNALTADPSYQPAQGLVRFIVISIVEAQTEIAGKKLNAKDYKGVIEAATKGLLSEPLNEKLLAYRGAAYIELGEKAKARKDLEALLGVNPESADAKQLRQRLK